MATFATVSDLRDTSAFTRTVEESAEPIQVMKGRERKMVVLSNELYERFERVEKQLALQLLQFGPTVLRAAECYKPSVLADYLFQTAQLYSSFYQRSPILKSEPAVRDARLRLCALFGQVLSTGLHLLGIETPNRI